MKSFWDKMWSIVQGCERIDTGCKNCSAESVFVQGKNQLNIISGGSWSGVVELVPRWDTPALYSHSSHVFVAGMGDLFHKDVPTEFIDKAFSVITDNSRHLFYILTKRTQRMVDYVSGNLEKIPTNVLLGVSVSDQATVSRHLPILGELASIADIWVNCEPLLGGIDLTTWIAQLSFVGAGPETGENKRPFNEVWLDDLYATCKQNGVPFFTNYRARSHLATLPELPKE